VVSAGIRGGRIEARLARPESGLVRRASAWVPGEEARELSMSDLERADGVRWVDVRYSELRSVRALGGLNRVCDGALTQRMARDLTTPHRFPATGTYGSRPIRMTAAFLVRHLQLDAADSDRGGPVGSVLKPVQLLVGEGWLLSCWLPPRLFRGSSAALEADCDGDDPDRLHTAVARSWPESSCSSASDLAELIRRELEVASGHRSRAV
jgi:hypothetical protein